MDPSPISYCIQYKSFYASKEIIITTYEDNALILLMLYCYYNQTNSLRSLWRHCWPYDKPGVLFIDLSWTGESFFKLWSGRFSSSLSRAGECGASRPPRTPRPCTSRTSRRARTSRRTPRPSAGQRPRLCICRRRRRPRQVGGPWRTRRGRWRTGRRRGSQ